MGTPGRGHERGGPAALATQRLRRTRAPQRVWCEAVRAEPRLDARCFPGSSGATTPALATALTGLKAGKADFLPPITQTASDRRGLLTDPDCSWSPRSLTSLVLWHQARAAGFAAGLPRVPPHSQTQHAHDGLPPVLLPTGPTRSPLTTNCCGYSGSFLHEEEQSVRRQSSTELGCSAERRVWRWNLGSRAGLCCPAGRHPGQGWGALVPRFLQLYSVTHSYLTDHCED